MTDDPQPNDLNVFDEIEHGSGDYTDIELLDQAQLNAQALLLATVEILHGHPAVLEAWRDGLAEIFMRGWDAERDWSASAILDALLTNYRSFGAVVVDHDPGSDHPTARIGALPDPALVQDLRLDPGHIHELLKIGKALAGQLGGELDWMTEPATSEVILTVRLREASS